MSLIGTDAVKIQFLIVIDPGEFVFRGFVISTIEEPRVVACPCYRAEFDPSDGVRQIVAGLHLADSPNIPIATRLRDAIGKQRPIIAGDITAQGHCSVVAEHVWVQDQFLLGKACWVERFCRVEDILVLEAVVVSVKISSAVLSRKSEAFKVPEFRQTLFKATAGRYLFKIIEGHLILLCYPRFGIL